MAQMTGHLAGHLISMLITFMMSVVRICGRDHCSCSCPCDPIDPLWWLLGLLSLLLSQLTESALAGVGCCPRGLAYEWLSDHRSDLVSSAFETSTVLSLVLFSQTR